MNTNVEPLSVKIGKKLIDGNPLGQHFDASEIAYLKAYIQMLEEVVFNK